MFKRLIETDLSDDDVELTAQVNENPGLLIRLHPDVRSYVLPRSRWRDQYVEYFDGKRLS